MKKVTTCFKISYEDVLLFEQLEFITKITSVQWIVTILNVTDLEGAYGNSVRYHDSMKIFFFSREWTRDNTVLKINDTYQSYPHGTGSDFEFGKNNGSQ